MTVPTRKNLIDGSSCGFLDMPSHLSWSDADLDRSLGTMLKRQKGVRETQGDSAQATKVEMCVWHKKSLLIRVR